MDAPRNSHHSDVLVLPGVSTVLVLQPPTGGLQCGDTVAPLSARAGDESVAVPLNPTFGFSATVRNSNISSSSNLQPPRDQMGQPGCSEVAARLSAGSFRHFMVSETGSRDSLDPVSISRASPEEVRLPSHQTSATLATPPVPFL